MKRFHSVSARETKELGAMVAKEIVASATKKTAKATMLLLSGDLGAGKTTFTQGLLRGLGVKKRIMSPTFVLFRRYPLKEKNLKNLYHIDAYRLKSGNDLAILGFEEIIGDPRNIILIEWPEKVSGIIPRASRKIRFSYGKKENERTISL